MVGAAGRWFKWDSTATRMGSLQKEDAWGSGATLWGGSPQRLCPWWPHQPGGAELRGVVGAGWQEGPRGLMWEGGPSSPLPHCGEVCRSRAVAQQCPGCWSSQPVHLRPAPLHHPGEMQPEPSQKLPQRESPLRPCAPSSAGRTWCVSGHGRREQMLCKQGPAPGEEQPNAPVQAWS